MTLKPNLKILLTGVPGCGKTTLIERITARLDRPIIGFITREIREQGQRVGFTLDTFDGRSGLLAHRDIKSGFQVGRYGVDPAVLDDLAVGAIQPATPGTLVVIDEIGKMEIVSPIFRKTLTDLLSAPFDLLGSISLKGGTFIQRIKERPDVTLIQVHKKNREALLGLTRKFVTGPGLPPA